MLILDSFDAPSLIKRGKSPAPRSANWPQQAPRRRHQAGIHKRRADSGMHPREKKGRSKNYLPSERKKRGTRERRVHLMIVDAEAETKGRHITVRRTITQE